MKYYFYKKKRNAVVPEESQENNALAKAKLDILFERKEELRIPEKFIYKWDRVALIHTQGDIEKANSLYLIDEECTYDLNNTLNDLCSNEWLSETVTVFTQKGLGKDSEHASIERLHPAPFSFQDVARLIRFFTKKDSIVLDPFVGVASTLKACAVEKRIGYGIELNEKYYELGLKRLETELSIFDEYKSKQHLILGDALEKIKDFDSNTFDFIVTSPPYWNILDTIDHKAKNHRIANNLDTKYSDSEVDLGNIKEYDDFVNVLSSFFSCCSRILKPNKYMCVIVSDFRKKEKFYLFHSDLSHELEKQGQFTLKGIRILHQKFKSIFPYGYPYSFVPNIHHQYVLIFQNQKNGNKEK